jgi:hypothetical protein
MRKLIKRKTKNTTLSELYVTVPKSNIGNKNLTGQTIIYYTKGFLTLAVFDHGNHKYSLCIWLSREYCKEKADFGQGKQLIQQMSVTC